MAWVLWAVGWIYGPSLALVTGVGVAALASASFRKRLIGEGGLPTEIERLGHDRHDPVKP